MNFPEQVKIVEVGPRDGLQNESVTVPAEIKVQLVEKLADAGLVVPEFQITTETTVVRTTNYSRNLIDGNSGQNGSPLAGDTTGLLDNIIIDRRTLEDYLSANGTAAFVDHLDKVLTAHTLSAETRAILEATIDNHTTPTNQVRVALYLILNSPDYLIQR